jgi:Type II secretion system protein C
MEILLRRYLWAIDCTVIFLVALFGARATWVTVESSYFSLAPPVRPTIGARPAPESRPSPKDVADIVGRNIFCSTCPPPGGPPDAPDEARPTGPQKTSLPLKLMAIMYGSTGPDSRWSTAVIQDSLAFTGPYRIGDEVHGATVVDIGETRVYLNNAGRPEFLDLFEPPSAGASPPGASPLVAAAAPAETPAQTPPQSAPPSPPRDVGAAPSMTMTTKLFKVRGDRIERHPH